MNEYKFTDEAGEGVLRYADGAFIPDDPANTDRRQYLGYVAAGGKTDPWKTPDELHGIALSDKLRELGAERDSRVDEVMGTGRKDRIITQAIKSLRREQKGIATLKETETLDTMEALDEHLDGLDSEYDAAGQWLEDPARTIKDIQGYNVVTDPGWSVLA